jgi:hypothetical protein
MVRIRRFSVIRTATVVALMYVIAIAIIGIPLLVILALAGSVAQDGVGGGALLLVGGVVGVLVLGIVYAIVGWVITAVACLLYNAAASFTGGIEVQVEHLEAVAQQPAVPDWVPPAQPG